MRTVLMRSLVTEMKREITAIMILSSVSKVKTLLEYSNKDVGDKFCKSEIFQLMFTCWRCSWKLACYSSSLFLHKIASQSVITMTLMQCNALLREISKDLKFRSKINTIIPWTGYFSLQRPGFHDVNSTTSVYGVEPLQKQSYDINTKIC